jgi:hypothetical protein
MPVIDVRDPQRAQRDQALALAQWSGQSENDFKDRLSAPVESVDSVQIPTPQGPDVYVHYSLDDLKEAAHRGESRAALGNLRTALIQASHQQLGGVVLTVSPKDEASYLATLADLFERAGILVSRYELARFITKNRAEIADPYAVQQDLGARALLARPLQSGLRSNHWTFANLAAAGSINPTAVLIDILTSTGEMLRVDLNGSLRVALQALKAA